MKVMDKSKHISNEKVGKVGKLKDVYSKLWMVISLFGNGLLVNLPANALRLTTMLCRAKFGIERDDNYNIEKLYISG